MKNLIADNIASMAGYTPGEQPKGGRIVKLNTNENPFPPSPLVERALKEFDYSSLNRYPDPNSTGLAALIARTYGAKAENVFAGNGSDEVLALATRCFVGAGGSIGSFRPSYSLYPVLAEIRGVQTVFAPLGEGFAWRRPAKDFTPDLFFLTNPNAPTGVIYPRGEIISFARDFEGVVLVDEAYADFALSTMADYAASPENRNLIVSRTLSKSFSLAGLRFGYAIGPAPLIEAMYKAKDSYNVDAITQALAYGAISDVAHMEENTRKIIREREYVAGKLKEMGWSATDSRANFVFARPPKGNAAEIFASLKAKNIFVRHFPSPETKEYLRITIGTREENNLFLAAVSE